MLANGGTGFVAFVRTNAGCRKQLMQKTALIKSCIILRCFRSAKYVCMNCDLINTGNFPHI